ncbi:MAG: zinc ribbon domain-containing protein [Armatimonadetes bacterium]|nr:zinc ribbon domain-containing protein [Armatimonadota bacterium]MDE2206262.1 zinc ribbon domain-containing protein [Armatimonadota bacterium]
MPIYEYFCPDCRKPYSRLVRTSGIAAPACPACGGSSARRLISAPALAFKQAQEPAPCCGGGACGVGQGSCACAAGLDD